MTCCFVQTKRCDFGMGNSPFLRQSHITHRNPWRWQNKISPLHYKYALTQVQTDSRLMLRIFIMFPTHGYSHRECRPVGWGGSGGSDEPPARSFRSGPAANKRTYSLTLQSLSCLPGVLTRDWYSYRVDRSVMYDARTIWTSFPGFLTRGMSGNEDVRVAWHNVPWSCHVPEFAAVLAAKKEDRSEYWRRCCCFW